MRGLGIQCLGWSNRSPPKLPEWNMCFCHVEDAG